MAERQKTVVAWSTGKDSAYALHKLNQSREHQVVGLVSMFSAHDRVFMHGIREELVERQAASAHVPLHRVDLPAECSLKEYEALFVRALRDAYSRGVRAVAFGDLYLEGIREHRTDLARQAGLDAIFPLWLHDKDTARLARYMVAEHVDAILTCIDPKKLDRRWIGQSWQSLLGELPSGVDPCAELGEFHTFAFSCPAFQMAIPVQVGEIVERDGFIFADLLCRGHQ